MSYKQINSLQELKETCNNRQENFFINLRGGARSSKTIEFDSEDKIFYVFNDIDGTEQEVQENRLVSDTNIIAAIYSGNFYMYA